MKKHVLMLTASAFILACGPTSASAQQSPVTTQQPADTHSTQHPDQPPSSQENPAMMGRGGMMGRGMMGPGMMGPGMMGPA